MDFTEHWRLRLTELFDSSKLSQAAFASRIGIAPDYMSRLLYGPGKKGRKNLGPTTIRKISETCGLPPGWFDMPLGTPVDHADLVIQNDPQTLTVIQLKEPSAKQYGDALVEWPFKIVQYERVQKIRDHFKGRNMPNAVEEIDKHLDILVTRWENEISKQKSSAA